MDNLNNGVASNDDPLLTETQMNVITASVVTAVGGLLMSPLAIPTAIVMVKHHIAISLLSILFHRHDVHKGLELSPIFQRVAEEIVTGHTIIDRSTWGAAHTQHHKEADNDYDENHATMGDTHPPSAIGERGVMRLVRQVVDPMAKSYYMIRTSWLKTLTTHRDNNTTPDTHIPNSTVDLRGDRSIANRVTLGGIEYLGYLYIFGVGPAAFMLFLQALLASSAIMAINGAGHSAAQENDQGNFAQNITSDGKTFGGRRWNNGLSWLTAGEEHHGNHHENMRSADITLGDPKQFDISYWYIKNILERFGIASDVKVPKGHPDNPR